MTKLNDTHDPARRSWVEAANRADSDFPIQNLPFGVFRRCGGGPATCGVAIGDQVFDLREAERRGLFANVANATPEVFRAETLNLLLDRGATTASAVRARLSDLLRSGGPEAAKSLGEDLLVSIDALTLERPVAVAAFTDFSCSLHHIGRLSRTGPWPALHHLPVAYNGRASSVQVSGFPVRRPKGQFAFPPGADKAYGPEPALDFELEFGAFLAGENPQGCSLSVDEAADRLFGYCLVNDWSARGILLFENALGPFLGKSFLTTISPWVVTDEALAPFKIARLTRTEDQPHVPDHLDSAANEGGGGLDVDLTAFLSTRKMRDAGEGAIQIVRTNFKHMYWTMAQMAAHQASNGCNLQTGDLIASGTTSGPDDDARACLMEMTFAAGKPLSLPNGEERMWLEDGDVLELRGRAARDGFVGIGFGQCVGEVTSAG